MQHARRYRACGLRIESAVVLPFEEDASGSEGGAPDVTIEFGPVPHALAPEEGAGKVVRSPLWQAAPGVFLLWMRRIAGFLVTGGDRIRIQPAGGEEEDVATFCCGTAWTVLLQQRGILTLHAAAVDVGGEATVIMGSSGIGKSSLAAALGERGLPLLADDVTGIAVDAAGTSHVLPAGTNQRLWNDTLHRMGWTGRRKGQVRGKVHKYYVAARAACETPRPVGRVLLLEEDPEDRPIAATQLGEAEGFWALWEHTIRRHAMEAMGVRARHFGTVATLVRARPVVRVRRPAHVFRLEALAARVERIATGAEEVHARGENDSGRRIAALRRQRPRPDRTEGGRSTKADGTGIIWLASYPKSGNTWLRAVLTNYLQGGEVAASIHALAGGRANNRQAFDELVGVDSSDLTEEETADLIPCFREKWAEALLRKDPERRFAKTHEAYETPDGRVRFPIRGTAGVVYLVRSPLDVAVSYAHHLGESVDQAIARLGSPDGAEARVRGGIGTQLVEPMGTWSHHVGSWTKQEALPTHVARYEDLLSDPLEGFGAIVRFTGLEWDREWLERSIAHSRFERLKAQEEARRFREKAWGPKPFFREGVAGGWRATLSARQVRTVVERHGEIMGRFGYRDEAEVCLERTAHPA